MQIPVLTPIIHYFRIFYRYAGYRLIMFVLVSVVAGMLAGFGFTLMIPLLNHDTSNPAELDAYTRTVFNVLHYSGIGVSLLAILGCIVLIFGIKAVMMFVQMVIRTRTAMGINRGLAVELAQRYQEMTYLHFTSRNIGQLNNTVTVEIARTVTAFLSYCGLIAGIVNATVYLFYSTTINWQVTVLAVLAGAFFLWPMRILARMVRKRSIAVTAKNAQIQTFLLQMVGNFKYLKATNSFTKVMEQLVREINWHRRYSVQVQVLAGLPTVLVEPVAVVVVSILVFYLVGLRGDTFANNVVAILLCDRTMRQILQLQAERQRFTANLGGLLAVEDTLRSVAHHKERDTGRAVTTVANEIRCENLGFSYGAQAVLSGLTFAIPKRQSVGIVGESGSGKTTLLDLLTGLLEPQEGRVLLDGVDYREIRKSSLRRLFGYVTQDPVLFDDSIASNITLWTADGQDEQRLRQAADVAYCTDFIGASAEGFDTRVGDKGIKLSGGQKQRLGIAREVYRDPEVMIFDEATSALDSESEAYIRSSMRTLAGERTLIIVAHRLVTVRECDKILVLSKGHLVEEGTWEELLRDPNSLFTALCRAQGLA